MKCILSHWFVIVSLVFTVVTCGRLTPLQMDGRKSPPYEVVAPADIHRGDGVPRPTGEIVLTLFGAITAQNVDDALAFDMETLERLGLVRYEVHDPWLDAEVTYTGVLMSDLLDVARPSASATVIRVVALDDYEVDVEVADVWKWPILLATQADGEYMSVANGGPTRIVFPYDDFPEIDQVDTRNLWVWNVERMEVR